MVTNNETTVKISRWILSEVEEYINKNNRNKAEFPSKRNFVDRAVINFFENKGIKMEE
jgi:hypothetical protein